MQSRENKIYISGHCDECDCPLSNLTHLDKHGDLPRSEVEDLDWLCEDCAEAALADLAADSRYEEMKDSR